MREFLSALLLSVMYHSMPFCDIRMHQQALLSIWTKFDINLIFLLTLFGVDVGNITTVLISSQENL